MKSHINNVILLLFSVFVCGSCISPIEKIEDSLVNTAWVSNTEHDVQVWGGDNVSYSKSHDKIYFLKDGIGYGEYYTIEEDSYFGHSHSSDPYKFTWSAINGGVQINKLKYRLQNDLLILDGGDSYYKRSSISSDDREWLNRVQYYLMDDEERLDFTYDFTIESIVDKNSPVVEAANYKGMYEVHTKFKFSWYDYLYYRGITSFTIKYKVSDGKFGFAKTEYTQYVSTEQKSNPECVGTNAFEILCTKIPATFTVEVYAYDRKKKRNNEYLLKKYTFAIPNGSANSGTGGNTGGGTNMEAPSLDVITGNATNITASTAVLSGSCSSVNGAIMSEAGILLHTSSAISYNNAQKYSGQYSNFTASVNNLNMNTTYYYQAYAKDNKGNLYYGMVKDFSTIGYSNVSLQMVDLGLSVKWANKNIGASGPEDVGEKYAWGETAPKSSYTWSNYIWCLNATAKTVSKYCLWSKYGNVDNKSTLELTDDAARVNLGGSWRMPTMSEAFELINNCRWSWTQMNGIYGYKVVGNNGNYIFLPGDSDSSSHWGSYWTSTLLDGMDNAAEALVFTNNEEFNGAVNGHDRSNGHFVRAVCQ